MDFHIAISGLSQPHHNSMASAISAVDKALPVDCTPGFTIVLLTPMDATGGPPDSLVYRMDLTTGDSLFLRSYISGFECKWEILADLA